jgi:hypothetical protein
MLAVTAVKFLKVFPIHPCMPGLFVKLLRHRTLLEMQALRSVCRFMYPGGTISPTCTLSGCGDAWSAKKSTVSLMLVRLHDRPTNDKEIVPHKHNPRIGRPLFQLFPIAMHHNNTQGRRVWEPTLTFVESIVTVFAP